jgi:ketosteroid isomerase-like protein
MSATDAGASEQPQDASGLELFKALFPREMEMVEFVRSGGELPPELTARIAPDFEVEFLPPALGSDLRGEGLVGLIESWREWLEPYESYVITIEDVEEVGENEVFLAVRVRARTHRDGVVIEHAPAAVATIRDGLVVRMRFYLERDAARADAGG